MKRELNFICDGTIAQSLGIPSDREEMIKQMVDDFRAKGTAWQDAIESANNRSDLNDAEWTVFVYLLGMRTVYVYPSR